MSKSNQRILIGADPEIFLSKDGEFVSAHDLLPGTKIQPFPVAQGAIQVDGMAAEFNIDPASSEEEFMSNLDTVLTQLKSMVPTYDFLEKASVHFTKEFMAGIPPEALELGCEPDFNAYSKSINKKPEMDRPMRTAGGHIHVGGFESDNPYETIHFNQMCRLMQAMDEEVGLYSLAWDKDDERRSMYGKAGSFRPKRYGAEYRTLSNAWLFNKKLQSFVYQGALRAIDKAFSPDWNPSTMVANIINTSNREHDLFKNNKRWDEVNDLLAA